MFLQTLPTLWARSGFVRPLVIAVLSGAFAISASAKPKGEIGSPKPESTVVQKGDDWTITAGGADIWGQSDQFHFASNSVSGNCTLTTKITTIGDATNNERAKAGLMIRADESVGAAHATVGITRGGTIFFMTRNAPGTDTRGERIPNIALPVFLRITRTGNDFAGFYSQDGKTWINIGLAKTVVMKPAALGGLAVSSHTDGVACTVAFSGFTMKR